MIMHTHPEWGLSGLYPPEDPNAVWQCATCTDHTTVQDFDEGYTVCRDCIERGVRVKQCTLCNRFVGRAYIAEDTSYCRTCNMEKARHRKPKEDDARTV